MPQRTFATGQDWAPQTTGNSKNRNLPTTARQISAAKLAGTMTTQKRYGAGGNTSSIHNAATISARKLEDADDVGTIQRVDKNLSKAIMQARTALKLSQKDLATKVNAKPQIVAEYENGKAIPNPQVISKLERVLKTQLPRPGKSKAPKKEGVKGGTRKTSATRGGPPKRR
mmetsp:Transcript_5507/g.6403  ORF Transcript_5507/g.6403 Transcript_5507/m.6403 type:complete len:171 (-) Transcript_5507:203-715(-)|eukprot:CAMPEP_0194145444 /NCGR_PEP_ID=MMETSP0152-20130528/17433_1 /TAXON_ID=1049557 /ORGANISM="Thalassiothrix antarctica, Strain L6-D1" /LENGTH=170 /DNA_ID=CAMNT_0038845685 /DNA_START=134 /DNA_END=646 /DNA_ORIENTATION=+